MSVYSAYLKLRPDVIYIHTNAPPEALEEARTSSDQWTRAIANLPSVELRYTDPPNSTSKHRVTITSLTHEADFVRTRVLRQFGGVYMDLDLYVIKDFGPLRRAGFNTVVARLVDHSISNGMLMVTPDSFLLQAFDELQDEVYKGEDWASHSVGLITPLVYMVLANDTGDQLLIMEQDAFFPASWEPDGVYKLYEIHQDWDGSEECWQAESIEDYNLTRFMEGFLRNRHRECWAWPESYTIHGWYSSTPSRLAESVDVGNLFGGYGGINLEYVLARNSNFGRRLYPVVRHALDAGIIQKEVRHELH